MKNLPTKIDNIRRIAGSEEPKESERFSSQGSAIFTVGGNVSPRRVTELIHTLSHTLMHSRLHTHTRTRALKRSQDRLRCVWTHRQRFGPSDLSKMDHSASFDVVSSREPVGATSSDVLINIQLENRSSLGEENESIIPSQSWSVFLWILISSPFKWMVPQYTIILRRHTFRCLHFFTRYHDFFF